MFGTLLKFNPNHDKANGRFSSGNGVGSTTSSDNKLVDRMAQAIKDSGGFTIDYKTRDDIKDGISVGVFPAHSLVIAQADLTVAKVGEWLKENKPKLTDNRIKIGGWVDNGTVYLDLVRVYSPSDKDIAIEIGKKKNQIAIADLAAISRGDFDHAFINTGGTGVASKSGSKPKLVLFDNDVSAEEIVRALGGKTEKMALGYLLTKFNPNHVPAGSSTGGQFAPSNGGKGTEGGSGGWDYKESRFDKKTGTLHTSNVNDAATALGKGFKVVLKQPDEVSTLLDKLAQIVTDAEAKGEKAPVYDLCKVSVPKTNLFCAESKGIPRIKMPQLSGKPLPGSLADKLPKNDKGEVDLSEEFKQSLLKDGHTISNTKELASHLRASQSELNGAKVAKMAGRLRQGKLKDAAIFVSEDNYIVDGHHRWAANVAVDAADGHLGDIKMPVMKINMSIIPLLAYANSFSKRMGIPQAGVAKSSRCVGCEQRTEYVKGLYNMIFRG